MREWRRGVYTPPTLCSGRAYFMLAKEKAELPGNVWARIEEPYVLERGGYHYAMDVSLWHGDELETAVSVNLVHGSANGGRALAFNWPRAPRNRGRVVVSRVLGMSLLFIADAWRQQGYERFDARLHVHHVDGEHANCFLGNLRVVVVSEHVAEHNRARAGARRR